jgi:predicted ATP-grasp superfamily ATP-dependent carboligase
MTDTTFNILNLTPHSICVSFAKNGETGTDLIPSSGKEVRLASKPQEKLFELDGIQVYSAPQYEQTIEWPDIPSDISAVIVSMPVGQLVAELSKTEYNLPFMVLGPDTGPSAVIRDSSGKIIGTTRLICYKK